jgi:hypothetical protein
MSSTASGKSESEPCHPIAGTSSQCGGEPWHPATQAEIEAMRQRARAVPGGAAISLLEVPGFLTPAEADHLVDVCSKDRYCKSGVIGGNPDLRTSETPVSRYYFSNCNRDENIKGDAVVDDFVRRLGALVGIEDETETSLEQCKLIRYKYGQHFVPHLDDQGDMSPKTARPVTMFVHLNDVRREDGGATEFTELGITIQPIKGTVSRTASRRIMRTVSPPFVQVEICAVTLLAQY